MFDLKEALAETRKGLEQQLTYAEERLVDAKAQIATLEHLEQMATAEGESVVRGLLNLGILEGARPF